MVLVLTSSYTASLTAFLTVQQLKPDFQLETLLQSNASIGYQTGSFVKSYLMEEHNVSEGRLKEFSSRSDYKHALDQGPDDPGVAAIIDELPYVEIFLQTHCDEYAKATSVFEKSGWGFVSHRLPLLSQCPLVLL